MGRERDSNGVDEKRELHLIHSARACARGTTKKAIAPRDFYRMAATGGHRVKQERVQAAIIIKEVFFVFVP
jgi:hypothetical protein